jgi:hypothetical protein
MRIQKKRMKGEKRLKQVHCAAKDLARSEIMDRMLSETKTRWNFHSKSEFKAGPLI